MRQKNKSRILSKIRGCILIIIIGLALSGITAFPIESELEVLSKFDLGLFNHWIDTVYHSVKHTNQAYPWLAYGTDWLAFAHIMLAILFYGPFRNPLKNIWIIDFGIICCISIIPLALIAGSLRKIPFYWQFIDCLFGLITIIPILYIKHLFGQLKSPKPC